MGGGGIFREISENFPEISGKFPGNFSGIRKREKGIVKRQNKILIHGLHENHPPIMSDPSVEYWKKRKNDQNVAFFPTPFTSFPVCLGSKINF